MLAIGLTVAILLARAGKGLRAHRPGPDTPRSSHLSESRARLGPSVASRFDLHAMLDGQFVTHPECRAKGEFGTGAREGQILPDQIGASLPERNPAAILETGPPDNTGERGAWREGRKPRP